MLIIQSGDKVYGVDQATGKFKQLPLTYTDFPTQPTPESLNASIDWLLDFFKRKNLSGYSILIHEETGAGGQSKATIVYADIKQGSSIKKENLALYTIAVEITEGEEKNLENTLYEELT